MIDLEALLGSLGPTTEVQVGSDARQYPCMGNRRTMLTGTRLNKSANDAQVDVFSFIMDRPSSEPTRTILSITPHLSMPTSLFAIQKGKAINARFIALPCLIADLRQQLSISVSMGF